MDILRTQILTIIKVIEKLKNETKDNSNLIKELDNFSKDLQKELDKVSKDLSNSISNEVKELNNSLEAIRHDLKANSSINDSKLMIYTKKQESLYNSLKIALNGIINKLDNYASKDELAKTNDKIDNEVNILNEKIKKVKTIKGQDGHDGKDGKDGKDGLNGKNGIDGKDAKELDLEIGEVKVVPIDDTDVRVTKKDDKYILDFDIPKASGKYMHTKGQDVTINNISAIDNNITLTTDNIPETVTNMYVPTLPTDTPTTKYLNGNKEWATVTGGVTDHTELTNLNGDSNYQHITDADRTKLNNTSGVNTGDQAKIVSQIITNNYTQNSTLDNGKVYTYIRDEDNVVIETVVT